MKTIKVAAAVIRDNNRIFATARGYGEFKGGWEFFRENWNNIYDCLDIFFIN